MNSLPTFSDDLAFIMGNHFDCLVSSSDFIDWVFGILIIFFFFNNMVMLWLVIQKFFLYDWTIMFRLMLNSRSDNDEELEWVSSVCSLRET